MKKIYPIIFIVIILLLGVSMRNSQLFQRFLNGEKLTPAENSQLSNAFDGYDKAVENINADSITTRTITAEQAHLTLMPNQFIVLDRQSDLSVDNANFTTVTNFLEYSPVAGDRASQTNDFFELDTTNGRIYMKTSGHMIGFYVFNIWETNATGNRSARIYQYNADGTEITYSVVYRIQATNGSSTSFATTIYVPWGGSRSQGDYAVLKVYQNSGAALNLQQAAFGAFVIR